MIGDTIRQLEWRLNDGACSNEEVAQIGTVLNDLYRTQALLANPKSPVQDVQRSDVLQGEWPMPQAGEETTDYTSSDPAFGPKPKTADGWIKCSDQMPPNDVWILCYREEGSGICPWSIVVHHADEERLTRYWKNAYGMMYGGPWPFTHWKPLVPPKD